MQCIERAQSQVSSYKKEHSYQSRFQGKLRHLICPDGCYTQGKLKVLHNELIIKNWVFLFVILI